MSSVGGMRHGKRMVAAPYSGESVARSRSSTTWHSEQRFGKRGLSAPAPMHHLHGHNGPVSARRGKRSTAGGPSGEGREFSVRRINDKASGRAQGKHRSGTPYSRFQKERDEAERLAKRPKGKRLASRSGRSVDGGIHCSSPSALDFETNPLDNEVSKPRPREGVRVLAADKVTSWITNWERVTRVPHCVVSPPWMGDAVPSTPGAATSRGRSHYSTPRVRADHRSVITGQGLRGEEGVTKITGRRSDRSKSVTSMFGSARRGRAGSVASVKETGVRSRSVPHSAAGTSVLAPSEYLAAGFGGEAGGGGGGGVSVRRSQLGRSFSLPQQRQQHQRVPAASPIPSIPHDPNPDAKAQGLHLSTRRRAFSEFREHKQNLLLPTEGSKVYYNPPPESQVW